MSACSFLFAHDAMVEWAKDNAGVLGGFRVLATGTTGNWPQKE
jgi:methylglyoxal synthase